MITRLFKLFQAHMKNPIKKPIISIVGTTGVGKSQFSIELAKKINGEIINADSMQVYKGVDIITNKHPLKERDGIVHHVIDHVGWGEEYFIHRFNKEANKAIEDIHARGKIPIIVGGTHYYLQTLLFNNKTLENEKERELTDGEIKLLDGPTDRLFEELRKIDPLVAEKFHPQDHRKLRRAVEIWYTTGQKPSDLYIEQKLDELEQSSLKYNTLVFWLYSEPKVLQDRLDKRVDKMMEIGAKEEIDELYKFYSENNGDCTSGIFQVIGFKEFLPWMENKKQDQANFTHGLERMKIRTRQYAKYQVKWIQKTLHLELQKESKFDYVNGGRLYILDATDLSHWDENVRARGLAVVEQFFQQNMTISEAPDNLTHLLIEKSNLKSNKSIGSEKRWKHYKCDICKDKNGVSFIAVGEYSWSLHLNSRRHKKNTNASSKRKHVEEMIRLHRK
ncbi:Mod5 protein [Candida orthopsilosis Co 90-125]|uniref:tRNA dimethylallyltransferase n=1 Tax=Candida orthopsilosis (strain 90-125) TaxID=1136231 RepID=H8WWT1_CANO9|nr:Mod5 protein [Candida orthopsilosis Co 90-125]CCG21071.1 Mod5 protein [Candida orthopsilosis Co 90-125]